MAANKKVGAAWRGVRPPCASPNLRACARALSQIEEKYQRILKECQKRPENRACFDCRGASTARGNQYVVLNFNTFVCTTCSGIHREMQHKIKSVGMSTFTTDEIKIIDKGGNADFMGRIRVPLRNLPGKPPDDGTTSTKVNVRVCMREMLLLSH